MGVVPLLRLVVSACRKLNQKSKGDQKRRQKKGSREGFPSGGSSLCEHASVQILLDTQVVHGFSGAMALPHYERYNFHFESRRKKVLIFVFFRKLQLHSTHTMLYLSLSPPPPPPYCFTVVLPPVFTLLLCLSVCRPRLSDTTSLEGGWGVGGGECGAAELITQIGHCNTFTSLSDTLSLFIALVFQCSKCILCFIRRRDQSIKSVFVFLFCNITA